MKSALEKGSEFSYPIGGYVSSGQKLEFGHDRRIDDDGSPSYKVICMDIQKTLETEMNHFLGSFSQTSTLFLSFVCRYFLGNGNEFAFCMHSNIEPVEVKKKDENTEKKNQKDHSEVTLGILKFDQNSSFNELVGAMDMLLKKKNEFFGMEEILGKSDLKKEDINIGIFSRSQYEQIKEDFAFDLVCVYDNTKSKEFCVYVNEKAFYDANLIDRMEKNFSVFLKSVYAEPMKPIMTLETITKEERDLQIFTMNKQHEIDDSHIKGKTMKQLYEEACEKFSGQVAIEFENKSITFKELNELSNQLAYHLQKKYQVKENEVLGISIEKSIDLIVAIVAAWKCGCTYFPVEGKFPEERIRFLFEDTKCKFIICNNNIMEKFNFLKKEGVSVVPIDLEFFDPKANKVALPKDNLAHPSELTSESCLYISYTSGSTGKPKAVIHEHGASISLYLQLFDLFKLEIGDRMLLFASISFDEHLNTINTLLRGSTIVIVPEETRYSPEDLHRFIVEKKIDAAKLTPSVLKSMKQEKINSLKKISIMGEVCDHSTMKFWSKNVDHFAVHYGSQESILDHSKVWKSGDLPKNVGQLIGNYKCYICDKHMNVKPLGLPGELCVAGPTIKRGYLGRPEITKQKFIKNPFCKEKDEMLYKTGDYGYLLSNGDLVFSKRIDKMVKIRGMRVELGEIEICLKKSSFVKNCVVGVKSGTDGNQILFSMVIPNPTKEEYKSLEKKIKDYLSKQLPYYMVPQIFIFKTHFPFTFSGKLDKKELLNFNILDYFKKHTEFIPAKSEEEITMAEIFSEILGVKKEEIGTTDDFYLLGGNSLGLILLKNKIKERFNVGLEFTMFLELHEVNIKKLVGLVSSQNNKKKKNNKKCSKIGPKMKKFCKEFLKNNQVMSNGVLYKLMEEQEFEEASRLNGEMFCDPVHGPLYVTHLGKSADQFSECFDPFLKCGLDERLNIVTIDQKTGKMLSLVISFDQESESAVDVPEQGFENFKVVFDMLDIVDAKVDENDLIKPVMHAFIHVAKPGLNPDVFWKLELLTEVLAQHRGFKTIFDEPVSHITQFNGESLGQKRHPGLLLEEFEFPRGSGKYPYKGVIQAHFNKFGDINEKKIVVEEMYCLTRDIRESILDDNDDEEELESEDVE